MFDESGRLIFAVSHRQFEDAMSEVWDPRDVYYETEQVLLYLDGERWTRVPLPADLGPHAWFGGIIVTEDKICLLVTSETHSEDDFTITSLAMVGVPAS